MLHRTKEVCAMSITMHFKAKIESGSMKLSGLQDLIGNGVDITIREGGAKVGASPHVDTLVPDPWDEIVALAREAGPDMNLEAISEFRRKNRL